MTIDRDTSHLHPVLRETVERICHRMAMRGLPVYVNETLRSQERQESLFHAGMSKTLHSKHLADENGFSHAADLVDGRYWAGFRVAWGASDPTWRLSKEATQERKALAAEFFKALGEEVHPEGLTWGGDWHDPVDPAHVELKS